MKVYLHWWHDGEGWELDCRDWKAKERVKEFDIPESVVIQYAQAKKALEEATDAVTKALMREGYRHR